MYTGTGYAVGSFAGYVCFDGNGKLQGGGKANIGGSSPVDIQYTGTYTIKMDVATGVAIIFEKLV